MKTAARLAKCKLSKEIQWRGHSACRRETQDIYSAVDAIAERGVSFMPGPPMHIDLSFVFRVTGTYRTHERTWYTDRW